ncbi:MAG: LamG domain-containing protein [Stenomitos rutilans HA7619-LM2]|jgi:hypothetical protein|nr:LamG domain-containing protein [Stenomitos rutilans HA7619-LM2]MBW4469425.1 LamG domain-containing protein [Stenomitos rutilans HA7619-LM2]
MPFYRLPMDGVPNRMRSPIAVESAVTGMIAALATTNLALRLVAKTDYVTLASGVVTQILDISGNSNTATQSSSGVRPVWNATAVADSKPAIVFDRSTYLDIANSSSMQISAGMTYYGVARYDNFADSQHNTIIEKGPHGVGANYVFGKGNSALSNALKFTYVDSNFRDVVESTHYQGADNTFYVYCVVVRQSAGQVDFYVNGSLKSTVSDSYGLDYGATSTTGARIGLNNSDDEGLAGAIAELVIDRAEHTSTVVSNNTTALRAYWGI